ncbi:MAG: S8 family serine peptidase [Candidatus Bathyarchaeia archaeon]|jgi:subtilisin family serine protease
MFISLQFALFSRRPLEHLVKQCKGYCFILVLTLLAGAFFCPIALNAKETITVDTIVGFNGTPDPELVSSFGGSVLEVYSIIPAVHALLPQTIVAQLKENPKVAYVTENSQIQATGTIRWAIENIGAPEAWNQSTGTGVKVAVLDSGVGPINDVTVYGGYNFINNNIDTHDVYGHGTMVAGIIAASASSALGVAGVAPNAQIYAVKVLNDEGVGNLNQAISGIQWAVDHDMQIISMSWNLIDENNALKQAVDNAYSRGILLVGAAGNAGEIMSGVGCPACYDSVIAVSAVTENNRHLQDSCCGQEIELSAPGEVVYSTRYDNTTGWGTGTSYSTGYVTGTAALIWAKNPSLTNIQVRNILDITATDLQPADGSDRDIFFGYGLVNASAAVFATPNNFDAAFSWTPNTVYVGGSIKFDASASFGGVNGFTVYTWDFGDDTTTVTTEDSAVEHIFISEGTYNVRLTVSDDFGFQDSISKTVTVTRDTQAPVTKDNFDSKIHTSAFIINLTATDDLSGVAEIYYKINDSDTQSVSANGQPYISFEGTNKLEYWSKDAAGNQETPHKTINNIIIDSNQSTEPSSSNPTPTSTPDGNLPLYEQTNFLVIIGVILVLAVAAVWVLFWHKKK